VDHRSYIAGQAEVSVRHAARIGDAWLIVNTSGLGKMTALTQTYRLGQLDTFSERVGHYGIRRETARPPGSAQGAGRSDRTA
jgi:hypothetical protein